MSGNCAGVGGGVTTAAARAGVLPVPPAGQHYNSLVSQAGSTVTVAGTLVATALQGSGAGLTSANGSNIASGLGGCKGLRWHRQHRTPLTASTYDGSKITPPRPAPAASV